MRILIALLLVLGMSGCQRLTKPPKAAPFNSATTIGNISEAVTRLSASNRDIEAASARREAAISAYLDVVNELLVTQVNSPAVAAMQTLVSLARNTSLQSPDLLKLAAARQLIQMQADGRLAEAGAEEEKLRAEVIREAALDTELKAARQKLEDALSARISDLSAERIESSRKNQAAMNALTEEINDLKTGHTRSLQVWTARILVGAGILGIAASGALVWLAFSVNPLRAVTRALPLVAGSLLSIGCGFIVSRPWFIWVAGVTAVFITVGIIVLLRHGRITNKTLATTLRKTIQSAEEQQVENPAAALDFKEYQQDNLDDAEKRLVDDIKPSIDRSYIDKVQKSEAIKTAAIPKNPYLPLSK